EEGRRLHRLGMGVVGHVIAPAACNHCHRADGDCHPERTREGSAPLWRSVPDPSEYLRMTNRAIHLGTSITSLGPRLSRNRRVSAASNFGSVASIAMKNRSRLACSAKLGM